MVKLAGKVAIVTGAGRGRAYARRLAGLGAKIGSPISMSSRTGSSTPGQRT
jgi:NAD(P)-dependent dehydrogenase (short-subunit alcohol dehydrogenase family)